MQIFRTSGKNVDIRSYGDGGVVASNPMLAILFYFIFFTSFSGIELGKYCVARILGQQFWCLGFDTSWFGCVVKLIDFINRLN